MRIVAALLACGSLLHAAGESRIYVTSVAGTLVEQGLAAAAPEGDAGFQDVPAPGVQFRPSQGQATEAPWINSNAWRFRRGLSKARYGTLPAGSAPLAAAEAFTYGVEAILNPDPADVEELGRMLRFLRTQSPSSLPDMANIAVVDDGSREIPEVLNLLTRRNLLYRIVSAPDPALLTVKLGTSDFPREAARDPSDFAARIREKVGDDNRLVRIYGTSTAIVRLTGDRSRARLVVLGYGNRRRPGREPQQLRIRLRGTYKPTTFAAFGTAPDAQLADVDHPNGTTEFWLPPFSTIAIVDLVRQGSAP